MAIKKQTNVQFTFYGSTELAAKLAQEAKKAKAQDVESFIEQLLEDAMKDVEVVKKSRAKKAE